jgi:hypothetical protein
MPSKNVEHQHTPEEERKIDPPSTDPNPDDHAALERSQDR